MVKGGKFSVILAEWKNCIGASATKNGRLQSQSTSCPKTLTPGYVDVREELKIVFVPSIFSFRTQIQNEPCWLPSNFFDMFLKILL